MKIKVDGKWPFFSAFNDKKYIISHDERKIVVLREPKESREYRLENKSGKDLVVYQIDGGLIASNAVLKCDFGIYNEDDVLFFVELKGADYIHALEQLISTINILIVKPQINVARLNARIVLSKISVPAIIPTQEKKLQSLVKSRKGDFKKRCRLLKETI